jgi:hypothetical protein
MPRPPNPTPSLPSPAGYQPLTFVFFLLTFPLVVAVKSWAVLGTVLLCRQAWQPGAAPCPTAHSLDCCLVELHCTQPKHTTCAEEVWHTLASPQWRFCMCCPPHPPCRRSAAAAGRRPSPPLEAASAGHASWHCSAAIALSSGSLALHTQPQAHSRALLLLHKLTSLESSLLAPFSALYWHGALLSPIPTALSTLCTTAASVPPPRITRALSPCLRRCLPCGAACL